MNHVAERRAQFYLKARVHDLLDGKFRGYVEIQTRAGRGRLESRLKYCPLIRATWNEAIEDAERLADTLHDAAHPDGECFVFSARGASSFESLMSMLTR